MNSWHAHPDVWLLLGAVLFAYLLAWRRHGPDAEKRRKVTLFSLGMAALFLAAEWPIHDLAEGYLYSVHMVQHLLLTLVAAPLILAGTPAWMVRPLIRNRSVKRVMRFLTRPLVALVAFNGVLLASHWPEVVELTVRSHPAHFLAHVVLLGSAVLMWWPVFSPLPELPGISPPGQMLYLFLQSLAPTIPASFLTFGSSPLYKIYETFPQIWGISAISDQRMAGLIMKIAGGLILWGVITAVFFRWYNEERRAEGWDALRFRDVERDVRSEMSKS
ncbi:MAG: cytochrome c oxidase assembly protein [Actinomycetota bacterium]